MAHMHFTHITERKREREGRMGRVVHTHALTPNLHSPHSHMVMLLAIAESQEGKEEGQEEGRAGRLGEPTHIARSTGLHRGQCAVCK